MHAQYRAFRQRSNAFVAPPEFWKSNGDELLYTCDLETRAQAVDAIRIWMSALSAYRSDLATLTDDLIGSLPIFRSSWQVADDRS